MEDSITFFGHDSLIAYSAEKEVDMSSRGSTLQPFI